MALQTTLAPEDRWLLDPSSVRRGCINALMDGASRLSATATQWNGTIEGMTAAMDEASTLAALGHADAASVSSLIADVRPAHAAVIALQRLVNDVVGTCEHARGRECARRVGS